MFLLDSDTCIGVLRRKSHPTRMLRSNLDAGCAVSTITVHEVAVGIEFARERAAEARRVKDLLQSLQVIDYDWSAAEETAKLRAILERAGTSIGPYDLLIAGHALARGLVLVTPNTKPFSRVPGLKLADWMQN